jgi:hypothetical protein
MQPVSSGISRGLSSHPTTRSQANAPQSKLNFGQAHDVAFFRHKPKQGFGDSDRPITAPNKLKHPLPHFD